MGCLAYKIPSGHKTEFAEIATVVPIVAEYQVVFVRHDAFSESSAAASWRDPILQNLSLHAEQPLLASSSVTVLKVLEPMPVFRLQYPIVSGFSVDTQTITIPTYPARASQ